MQSSLRFIVKLTNYGILFCLHFLPSLRTQGGIVHLWKCVITRRVLSAGGLSHGCVINYQRWYQCLCSYTPPSQPRVIQNTEDEKCVSKRCWQSTIIICASHNQKRKTGGITVHIVGTWCSLTKTGALTSYHSRILSVQVQNFSDDKYEKAWQTMFLLIPKHNWK